jgi:hypothetical protein
MFHTSAGGLECPHEGNPRCGFFARTGHAIIVDDQLRIANIRS